MPARPAPLPTDRIVRVLIIDDSVVARAVIARALDAPQIAVVGAVPNAGTALAFLATTEVDLMVLDIDMPGIDGLSALPDLLHAGGQARVLVVSSACAEGAAATLQALALGAADTLVKPAPGRTGQSFADQLVGKVLRLTSGDERSSTPSRRPSASSAKGFDVLGIGASTGGIHALSHLLRAIPPGFAKPILITQHLPANFMPYFANQIAVLAGRSCRVVEDRMPLQQGRVYLAPGDAHVRVSGQPSAPVLRLSREPCQSGCMPSVDPMFDSIAALFRSRALGIVLSGMGRDGADGTARIVAGGGSVLVQDQASSTVWGMPRAALSAGATAAMTPQELGRYVAELAVGS